MPHVAAFPALATLAALLPAQTVHLVGPGGYAQINGAIAAAASGDIVLVQPGVYEMFFLNKALTIRATAPGAEAVLAGPGLGASNIVAPPAGATVHIAGMRLGPTYLWGTTTLDDCVIDGPRTFVAIDNATVVVTSCRLTPVLPVPALFIPSTLKCEDSEVTVIDSTIHGLGLPGGTLSTRAIELVNSRFRGSHLTVQTGPGPGPALQGDAASRIWLSDSTVVADPATCILPVSATILAAQGHYDRCTLSPNCSTLPAGFVLGVHAPQPPQNGMPFVLEFRAQPNSMVGVWADHTIAPSPLPGVEQALLLTPTHAFNVGNLIADNTGLAIGTWSVPSGAMFVDVPLWFQAFAGPLFPLQASAIAGGLVR
ncbi:MAG TPA: hypothetical protein VFZ65_03605 [Planctomycetota bacterium]|nr:hypothetical protein [Planctomycetota bacterium]